MFEFDRRLFLWLNAGPDTPRWLVDAALAISGVLPAVLAVLLLGAAVFVPRWRAPMLAALVSLLLAWLAVTLFRSVWPLPRPAMQGLGVQWDAQGLRPGFPSMHATTTFAFGMALWFARARGPARASLALALAVLWARVFLGLHFPSDVLCGALLGTALGGAVVLALRPWVKGLRPAGVRTGALSPASSRAAPAP